MKKTFVYKKVNDCEIKGDLYPVEDIKAPLLIYIHGGGLIWGAKEDILNEQVELYNNAGYHVFSIDYRLAPEAKLQEIIEDIEDALVWVREQNFFSFDRNKIGVIGNSAGAYLALSSGTFKNKPNAIISFHGYGTILGDWYLNPSSYYLKTTTVPELLVKQLVEPKQIAQAPIQKRYSIYLYYRQQGKWVNYITGLNPSIDTEQLENFCPIKKVNSEYPPTLLIHGDRDEDVPYEESVQFAKALRLNNIPYDLIITKNGNQTFENHMNHSQGRKTLEETLHFLAKHLKA